MAVIKGFTNEKIFQIKKFLGVNECPDGDTNLKMGESAAMQNFRITDDYGLQVRPGTSNVANLMYAYAVDVAATATTLRTETIATTATYQMYPDYAITAGGLLQTDGTVATMNYANHATYTDNYWSDGSGNTYKFVDCVYGDGVVAGVQQYRWNKWNCTSGATYRWRKWSVVTGGGYYYYTSSGWTVASTGSGGTFPGYSSYTFNSSTGQFTNAGTYGSARAEDPGTVYNASGSSITRVSISSAGNWTRYTASASGPFYVPTTYSKGSTDYGYVYDLNSATYPDGGTAFVSGTRYWFEDRTYITTYVKGETNLGYVYGATAAYPNGAEQIDGATYYWYDGKAANTSYAWNFKLMSVVANPDAPTVQGIWSGFVGSTEFIVAACHGRLWSLTEADGVWTKVNIGTVDTTNSVNFFSLDGVLYIQNGVTYKQWDASTYQVHTYTVDGDLNGEYNITVDTVKYKFILVHPTAGWKLVFDESDLSLKLNGGTLAYTINSNGTDLTAGLVAVTYYHDASDVVGYRPLIRTEIPYTGGGTTLEQVNKLNGLRRVWLSPDGSHATFQLPETGLASADYVKVLATGVNMSTDDYTVSTANGTITFDSNPTSGTNTLEVGYTAATSGRSTVNAMRYAEIFNGTTDNRVFLYGDGSNEAFYSGLDYNGLPRPDYFPDLNEIAFGDSGTPLTGLIRTYNRMMAFKDNAAFNVNYGSITLVGGTVTAGFYVTPVNKDLGNKALGQVCLVDNMPRTLDAGGIYEWSISNIAGDQMNAKRISQRVGTTLLTFDLAETVTYYDKIRHEFYVLHDGKAIVQNTENDTWFIYDGIDATCMIVYQDEVYFGLTNGYIVHFSRNYMSDNGADIECYWESGSMDFDRPYSKKYSAGLWLGIKPEASGCIRVTVVTDKDTNLNEMTSTSASAQSATGFFSFLDLDFTKLSFNVNAIPTIDCHKLKAKKFINYKLILSSSSNNTTATITTVPIRVRYTGLVR